MRTEDNWAEDNWALYTGLLAWRAKRQEERWLEEEVNRARALGRPVHTVQMGVMCEEVGLTKQELSVILRSREHRNLPWWKRLRLRLTR